MPTLNWIGKDKVVNHHAQVPFRVLDHQYGYDSNNPERRDPTKSGNKIIHGENLEALKALLPEFEGKIDCEYIHHDAFCFGCQGNKKLVARTHY